MGKDQSVVAMLQATVPKRKDLMKGRICFSVDDFCDRRRLICLAGLVCDSFYQRVLA